jgi:hypothetical protein
MAVRKQLLTGNYVCFWRANNAIVYTLLIIFFCLALLGCGGGTRGTGGTDFTGKVADQESRPVVGISVTLLEAQQASTTDNNGEFKFNAAVSGDLTFRFNGQAAEGDVVVQGVPAAAKKVELEFEVRTDNRSVSLKKVVSENQDDDDSEEDESKDPIDSDDDLDDSNDDDEDSFDDSNGRDDDQDLDDDDNSPEDDDDDEKGEDDDEEGDDNDDDKGGEDQDPDDNSGHGGSGSGHLDEGEDEDED